MQPEHASKKIVVFTSGTFSLPLMQFLLERKQLAGVVIPDASETPRTAMEINNLAAQLHHANIPYQACCKAKLPLFVNQLDAWQADIGIIACFSYVLPKEICGFFQFGLYNLHASKLPLYKGPMPVYWQIRNQEKMITLSLHHAIDKVDAGAIVVSDELQLHPLETLQSATNQLSKLAVYVVDKLLGIIDEAGAIPEGVPQNQALQKQSTQEQIAEKQSPQTQVHKPLNLILYNSFYARYPTLADGVINPSKMTAAEINALCRASGCGEFAANISLNGVPINVIEASVADYPSYGTQPGTVLFVGDPEGFIIQVKDGSVRLDVLANADGIYSGFAFAERFQIDAGMQMQASLFG